MTRNILKEIKADNQEAADWLLYYPYRRRQFYKDKQDTICSSVALPEVIARTGPGNPTALRAMHLSSLAKCEQWLEVIETVEDNLDEKKLVFLTFRREAAYITKRVRGKPAWVIYVQCHYADEMARRHDTQPDDYWLSENTMKYWWTQIVELTARIAMKKLKNLNR